MNANTGQPSSEPASFGFARILSRAEHSDNPDAAHGDGDGFGAGEPVHTCSPTIGWVLVAGDCDDANRQIHPDAEESCDGFDNDCSGEADDGVGTTWFEDGDGDGFGDPESTSVACDAPPRFVDNGDDCDDGDADTFPGGADEQVELGLLRRRRAGARGEGAA